MRRRSLGEVRPSAAAGVEDVDVVGRQAVGDAQVLLQRHVDAGDHVTHHLGGRVPDAKLLAKVGVEGLQEGLVEVGHGLSRRRSGRRRPLRSTRSRAAAVQSKQLDKAQGLQLRPAIGQLLEEGAQHRALSGARLRCASRRGWWAAASGAPTAPTPRRLRRRGSVSMWSGRRPHRARPRSGRQEPPPAPNAQRCSDGASPAASTLASPSLA